MSSVKVDPDEIKREISEIIRVNRFESELPSRLDFGFMRLADSFYVSTETQRREISDCIPKEASMIILERGTRLAVLAARTGLAIHLKRALISHAIEGVRLDFRENLIRLALISHVARKLGVDESELYKMSHE